MITAVDLRKRYLGFFVKKGHKLLPNASLVPENDPSALFINSGMHPLIPYLTGEPHPLGKKLVSLQRCLRTQDIESVGDDCHLTFFEMLGNWSLGDYWKKEAIELSFEFLTKELNINKDKISISCFVGDKDTPKDEEAAKVWESLGIPKSRIHFLGKKDNWWSAGQTGPCGPDTEMFYDTGKKVCGSDCQPGDGCGRYIEIWNDVFMEFNRLPSGKLEKLKQRNIDTGMGVERTLAVLQGKKDIYQTELFSGLIDEIEKISGEKYEGDNQKAMRVLADHVRAATFIIADGVIPSNTEQGYVLRRLIRRAIRYGKLISIKQNFIKKIAESVIKDSVASYPHLKGQEEIIFSNFQEEEIKFRKAIESGLKILEKVFSQKVAIDSKKYSQLMQVGEEKEIFREFYKDNSYEFYSNYLNGLLNREEISKGTISGQEAFNLYQTYGFPIETIIDLVQEKRLLVDIEAYRKELEKHKKSSQKSSIGKFKGGLKDQSDKTIKLHTTAHLLHQSLRQILGDHVKPAGSNITPERLRFDFTHPEKLTEDQLKAVENLINQKIKEDLPVKMETMLLEQAQKAGALAFFIDKYGQKVKVYSIGNFSKEVCGGPHVGSLAEIEEIKIIKEESSGAGKRRIYAGFNKK